jgi:short-subunit dehydrogenase involved in D-alanine esterification of teichoic acids
MKTMEGFYNLMMPIWAVTSNSFENSKKLHEEYIELMQDANERVTDRVVDAVDHSKPNELMGAMTIACQAFGQTNLMIYNAMVEQQHQFIDSYFQLLDKGHQQIYKDASQI